MRRPLGPEPMTKTVRFRLGSEDVERLRAISGDRPMSEVLRDLIYREWEFRGRK